MTFVFTDIVSSTQLWEQAPDSMRRALERHDEIVNGAVRDFDGFVFATGGDGVAAAFSTPNDAVAASAQMQAQIAVEPWPDDAPLKIRVGMHTGVSHERGGDYFGPTVNRAARVMATAPGTQIVASGATAELLGSDDSIELVDLGHHELKGLSAPLHLVGIGTPTVPWNDIPLAVSATAGANKLPSPISEWIGPYGELGKRATSVQQNRLVSIVGPGGMGKTRSALEIAHQLADEFAAGIWMVELAGVTDADAVAHAFAAALGVRPQAGTSTRAAVVEWIGSKELLIIVDNCEHVLSEASEAVAGIIERCPKVTVLATSRERLGVVGEQVVAPPRLEAEHASALFRNRAHSVQSDIEFDENDEKIINSICERLDGVPLAIELAAARLRTMSLADLESRLDNRFRLLRERTSSLPDRHRTLEAAVDWSYQLLEDEDKEFFELVSVFAGWFDLDAADAIAWEFGADAFDSLPALVEKSLLEVTRDGQVTRYRMLETLRDFARARLVERGTARAVEDRHTEYFVEFAERTDMMWRSEQQLVADDAYDAAWNDLRVVHQRLLADNDVARAERLVAATFDHSLLRVRSEHAGWVLAVVDMNTEAEPVGGWTFVLASWWSMLRGNIPRALDLAMTGSSLRNLSTPDSITLDAIQGFTMWLSGDTEPGLELLSSVDARRDQLEEWLELMVLRALTGVIRGETERLAERTAELAERIGSPAYIASARYYQGLAAILPPADAPAAVELHEEGVKLAREAGAHLAECQNLQGLQSAASTDRRPDAIVRCREAVVRIHELGFWLHLWPVLAHAVRVLERSLLIVPAAQVAGFLHANQLGWGDRSTRSSMESLVERFESSPETAAELRLGAGLDRETVVATVLEGLDLVIEQDRAQQNEPGSTSQPS